MQEKVNREEFCKSIRRKIDIEEELLNKLLDTISDVVCYELSQGREVKIPGLCHVRPKKLKASFLRIRGKTVLVPDRLSVNIRPVLKLLNSVQGGKCEKQPVT